MADTTADKAVRNTRQKEVVWQTFAAMRNHPTADMVYEAALKAAPGIGRATVYRILNSYLESGLAIRVPVYDGADRFDITVSPHDHARCKICGAVEDIFTSKKLDLPASAEAGGFNIEGGAVMYYGVCRKCSKQ